MMYKTASVC